MIHEHNYHYFDMESLELIKQAFLAKQEWRKERVHVSKAERACARGYIRRYDFMRHSDLVSTGHHIPFLYIHRLQLETAAAAQRIDRIFTPSLSTSAVAAEGNIDDKDKDIEKDRMDDIHEIPYLLLQDFNPMMVTCTVKKVILF